jgi:hypothetical protein
MFVLGLLLLFLQAKPATLTSAQDTLAYLNQTIDWYSFGISSAPDSLLSRSKTTRRPPSFNCVTMPALVDVEVPGSVLACRGLSFWRFRKTTIASTSTAAAAGTKTNLRNHARFADEGAAEAWNACKSSTARVHCSHRLKWSAAVVRASCDSLSSTPPVP